MVEKCSHCGKEFIIRNFKKYYIYKLREFRSSKELYFCSYACMQTERREHPEKYGKKAIW